MAHKQKKRQRTKSPSQQISTYWERAQWPLQSLLFLLPLLVIYELGALFYAPHAVERLPRIYAESLLQSFFELFGVTGYHLPAIAVVVVLLSWHLARRDPWQPEPKLWAVMALESLLVAVPLFVFMSVLFRQPATQAGALLAAGGLESELPTWQSGVVIAIGAGIYEELVFRLIAIALLHMILVDLLTVPEHYGAVLAVVLSALAFALYHFDLGGAGTGLSWTSGQWSAFGGYLLLGGYFAAVYMLRGFGIAAGAHAAYDIMALSVMFARQ